MKWLDKNKMDLVPNQWIPVETITQNTAASQTLADILNFSLRNFLSA